MMMSPFFYFSRDNFVFMWNNKCSKYSNSNQCGIVSTLQKSSLTFVMNPYLRYTDTLHIYIDTLTTSRDILCIVAGNHNHYMKYTRDWISANRPTDRATSSFDFSISFFQVSAQIHEKESPLWQRTNSLFLFFVGIFISFFAADFRDCESSCIDCIVFCSWFRSQNDDSTFIHFVVAFNIVRQNLFDGYAEPTTLEKQIN